MGLQAGGEALLYHFIRGIKAGSPFKINNAKESMVSTSPT
jgi:hypothetical protein